ncbi:alpha-L-fucosidase [Flammeovirgaceae bacterium SG7u.111]|nr:alpha-L-fucosidase [Flammeovirgaceae bacterium SG7u.132]WPO37618.1 alpha-L-fucosidase [Flammeovirgaceae bacterium SG7u.111]
MKRFFTLPLLIAAVFSCTAPQKKAEETTVAAEGYEENWESIKKYEIPEWFKDAKLGIFIHWGPYAVPASVSEWYPRLMYQDQVQVNPKGDTTKTEPTQVYLDHVKKYGPLDEFGYKDFIPDFTGENFNAEEWTDIFIKAGAKYVVPVAEHHDSFAMYNSKITKWNSVNMGPKKDILGELAEAGRAKGLKIGASSHFAFNWDYFNKTGDAVNPEYSDFYGRIHEPYAPADEEFLELWWARTKDIIDNYQPDILWFDFVIDRPEYKPYHPKLGAYYYNKGLEWGKEVVLQNKNFHGFESFPPGTNVYDLERGKMADIRKEAWQTDTSIGKNSWGYVTDWITKTPNTIVDDLIDIVSKNGCLLLNIGPKADGTIPEDQKEVLMQLGGWLEVNGEAIYGTRYWNTFGEGPTEVATGHHTEGKNKELTGEDFRFTQKDGVVYAIAMDWPEKPEAVVKALGSKTEFNDKKIKAVSLLGNDVELTWEQTEDKLTINMPVEKVGDYAFTFKVEFE